MLNLKHIYSFGRILTSQSGGQPYTNTSPYKVSECSLICVMCKKSIIGYLSLDKMSLDEMSWSEKFLSGQTSLPVDYNHVVKKYFCLEILLLICHGLKIITCMHRIVGKVSRTEVDEFKPKKM